jgi:hypothetical protein
MHDAIRVYALKGLRAFFTARPPRVDADTEDEKVRQRDAARVQTVLALLDRKAPEGLPADEADAVRFVRREAIKALAQLRLPAMAVQKTKVQIPVALGLMKVLAGDKAGLEPPPSLSEKAEAAIGLCRTKTSVFEQYQPDATLYLTGRFLVEFATKYQEDFAGGSLSRDKDKRPALLPWKYEAERLKVALDEFQKSTPAGAKADYREKVKSMVEHSVPILNKMKSHTEVNTAIPLLEGALGKMWPMTPTLNLFQGVPNLQIEIPALKEGA